MQATNNRKTKLRISIGLLLLLGVAVVLCILFFLVKDSYIPRWVTWNEKAMNDGRLVLKDKMLTLYDKQGIPLIWSIHMFSLFFGFND